VLRTDEHVLRSAEQVCKRGGDDWTMEVRELAEDIYVEKLKTYGKVATTCLSVGEVLKKTEVK